MGKLPYQPQEDCLVQVSICSVNTFINPHPFSINLTEANRQKINSALQNSIGSNFILFPEYTYTDELQIQYQNFSNQNNCIIIGGSGLEAVNANFYAFAPVFLPNQELIKVYKRRITPIETVISGGKLIDYPDKVPRQIRVAVNDDTDVIVSVYVCYDFLVENKSDRDDIIFVPQYEPSPQQFISEGDKISKGWENFVFGANNSNNNQRSLGFASLNSQIINGLASRNWRAHAYSDEHGNQMNYHNTISYDIQGEKLLTFRINVGKPFSKASTFSFEGNQPILVPIAEFEL